MLQTKVLPSLCLLFLLVGVPLIQAEVFSQCANVQQDTFIMAIDDCKSYIYCNEENSFRDSCPDQTYFDAAAQECAFDDEGICLQRVDIPTTVETITIAAAAADATTASAAAAVTQKNNKEEETVVAATTTAPKENPPAIVNRPTAPDGSRPHCDTAGDGKYPHAQRCEYYYSCSGGYLTIVRCPYKYGWDYAELQCRPLSEARCLGL